MRRALLVLLLALFALPAAAQESQSSDEGRHRGGDAPSATATPSDTESDSNDTRERITRFDSDVTVARNGTLTVVETIGVYVTNDQIKHGIYRDFPTLYTDKHGNRVRVRFDVTSVTLDGHDEPYGTESISNGVRVKIGDKDNFVDTGRHTYVLTYMTNRQVGFPCLEGGGILAGSGSRSSPTASRRSTEYGPASHQPSSRNGCR